MGVTICLPLFGPPGRELDEGAALMGQQLRNLATELHERLHNAADTLDRLAAAGWSTRVAMYDVILTRQEIETKEDAVRRRVCCTTISAEASNSHASRSASTSAAAITADAIRWRSSRASRCTCSLTGTLRSSA